MGTDIAGAAKRLKPLGYDLFSQVDGEGIFAIIRSRRDELVAMAIGLDDLEGEVAEIERVDGAAVSTIEHDGGAGEQAEDPPTSTALERSTLVRFLEEVVDCSNSELEALREHAHFIRQAREGGTVDERAARAAASFVAGDTVRRKAAENGAALMLALKAEGLRLDVK